jgi:aminopeptidase N
MYRRLAAVGITSLVTVGVAAGPAAADDPPPGATPGAAGIGDPYFPLDGNGGYDVQHYALDLAYDPATDELAGTATVSARTTQALSSFNLDFVGFTIESVTVDGGATTWSRQGGELTVRPAAPLAQDADVTTVVSYRGVPQTLVDALLGSSGFVHTDDGAVVAGQPDSAATWFPANDHPLDAASFDVRVTVPEGLEAVSNGVLLEQGAADGRSTWHWRAEEPMAPYLAVLAIGEFDVRAYEVAGIAYWDALDPDLFTPLASPVPVEPVPGEPVPDLPNLGETAQASLARQPEIIDFLSGVFGPYPFASAGGIVDDDQERRFALETQTRPIYAPGFFGAPIFGDVVVVHELAHQWTGDLVRLAGWQHLWLNEGFATYAEWLWLEREGVVTAQEQFDFLMSDVVPADDPLWAVTPGDPGPAREQLFSGAVYVRAALTVHALRLAVGDDAFSRILREWTASQAGRAVTTEDFVAVAERVSGQDLDALFQTWLFTAAKPGAVG